MCPLFGGFSSEIDTGGWLVCVSSFAAAMKEDDGDVGRRWMALTTSWWRSRWFWWATVNYCRKLSQPATIFSTRTCILLEIEVSYLCDVCVCSLMVGSWLGYLLLGGWGVLFVVVWGSLFHGEFILGYWQPGEKSGLLRRCTSTAPKTMMQCTICRSGRNTNPAQKLVTSSGLMQESAGIIDPTFNGLFKSRVNSADRGSCQLI